MKIFIASLAGHRSRYVRTLLEHTPSGASPPELVTFDDPAELPSTALVHRESGPASAYRRARAILRTVRRGGDGGVLLLDGDASAVELLTLLVAPLIHPGVRLSTLIMRPPDRWSAPTNWAAIRSDLKIVVLRIAARSRHVSIHPLDDYTGTWSESSEGRRLQQLDRVIDPVEVRPGPRPADLPPDLPRPWVLVPGRLVLRKNIPLILAAWNARAPRGTLILAGDCEPSLRDLLEQGTKSSPRSVCWLDRWLAEDEMDRLVIDSDVVLLLHDNAAPSRNLGKAIAAGTPVIGSRIPQIERLVPHFRVTAIDLTAVALLGALADVGTFAKDHASSHRSAAIERGSPVEFARILLARRSRK